MAFFDLKKRYDEEVNSGKCPYLIVNKVAKESREKLEELEFRCKISDAIRWAVTGQEPRLDVDESAISRARQSKIKQYLESVLDNVDDSEVKGAVETSVTKSRYLGHLIYEYNDIQDEPRKGRVRILVRMVCSLATESK